MKGRIPKPTELKLLQGTLQKCRNTPNQPEFEEITEVPEPPKTLEGISETKWRATAKLLIESKVLKIPDLDALESYCLAYENMVNAQHSLRCDGMTVAGATGGEVKNPAHTVLSQAQGEIRQMGSLLGLNPSARGRINTGDTGKDKNAPAGFADLRPGVTR